jgi:hypothetical protein
MHHSAEGMAMHSHYREWPAANVWVFLDGEALHQCREACEEGGWALCYQTDSEGRVLVNAERTEALTVVRHGDVRLRLAEDAAEASFVRYHAKRRLCHRCGGPTIEWPEGYEEFPCPHQGEEGSP